MIARLSWKNTWYKPGRNIVSLLLLALGSGITLFVLRAHYATEQALLTNMRSVDMVIGAKGSPLQIILSGLYHIDQPTGNISVSEVARIRKQPLVKQVIPLAYGDYYKNTRIVGTTNQYTNLYDVTCNQGRMFTQTFELVVGARVARELGLTLGDTLTGSHGVLIGQNHDEHPYTVVGLLRPSGSVLDDLLLTPVESVWLTHGGSNSGKPWYNQKQAEITCALVQFTSPMGMMQVPRWINAETNLQAALPAIEANRLLDLIASGVGLLRILAYVLVGVAVCSMFLALLQALGERKAELALLRTMGASRSQLILLLLNEGVILTVLGLAIGWLTSRVAGWWLTGIPEAESLAQLPWWTFVPGEGWLLILGLCVGLAGALFPAWRAGHVSISKTLANG